MVQPVLVGSNDPVVVAVVGADLAKSDVRILEFGPALVLLRVS